MANLESDYYCRWYKLHYNSLTGRWLLQVWGGRGRLVGYFVHSLARQCRTTVIILDCENFTHRLNCYQYVLAW